MSGRILRGRTLSFDRAPATAEDLDAAAFEEDGGLLLRDGVIAAAGPFGAVRAGAPDAAVEDLRPWLLMPGFIDAHLHVPQMRVIASYGARLLDWLETYTFPEEARSADPAHAARIAAAFFDTLLAHGTTTPVAYCSSHRPSAEAFFEAAAARGVRAIGGQTMMDRNCPNGVRDTARSAHDDTARLIARWHGRGRAHVAITPRFAITSSPAQLEAAGALAAAHPGVYVQTHLAETPEEIARTAELFPEATDYTDVYDRAGLLGPRTLLGHCLHLSDRERARMAETGSVAVFCPTSNLFLGSGLFDMATTEAAGIRVALATDIGGGTSPSMLATMQAAHTVLALRHQPLPPLRAAWLATRGNAEALGLADRIGTLDAGSEADIVALDARATPAMALRMETVETLAEELFVLQTLGDDRSVRAVWVAGERVAPA